MIGLKKLIFLYSIDYYKDLACCGYKRECQDFQKILQLLNDALSWVRRCKYGLDQNIYVDCGTRSKDSL